MKIKTNRQWNLETKDEGDCLEIIEHHEGGDAQKPYVVIPIEAIDELVFQLLKFKKRNKAVS